VIPILEIDIGDDGIPNSASSAQFDHIVVNAGDGVTTDRIDGQRHFTDTEVTTFNGEADHDTLTGGQRRSRSMAGWQRPAGR
jgi:hypothetical protein